MISLKKSLSYLGIDDARVQPKWNLPVPKLVEESIAIGEGKLSDTGALAINTGKFTGRSPKDRFIVEDEVTKEKVWWGDINKKFSSKKFDLLYDKVITYLNSKKDIYVRDAYACADENYRMNIRAITEKPWSNIFINNMFLNPSKEELKDFSPEWTILATPGFMANPEIDGTRQSNFAILNFKRKVLLIGGTGYTGEMKKGIFSVLNFILPIKKDVLPMHCSANIGENGDVAIFFGLSGTGKTTLSSDNNRQLIGDDEHGWTDNSVFNFEGGCYAKCINLSKEKEPQIYEAIKSGSLLENIVFLKGSSKVDYDDKSITENTRVSYPINFIDNHAVPSLGGLPKNIFFLTADAFGVLPPISKLTAEQAMYHFISGYTAKVAGTEAGITEPQATFSACFGSPFLPLHPTKYAKMLGAKIDKNAVNVWLINTGWTGGEYGVGKRISLQNTRNIITAVLENKLSNVEYIEHPIFGVKMPTSCPNVDSAILNPIKTWENPSEYEKKTNKLAKAFNENFKQFIDSYNQELLKAGPKIK